MQIIKSLYEDLGLAARSWIHSRELKSNTVRSYAVETARFVEWACIEKQSKTYGDLESLSMVEFVEYVAKQRALKRNAPSKYKVNASSLNQTRRIVLAFLRWLVRSRKVNHGATWQIEPAIIKTWAGTTSLPGTEDPIAVVRLAREVLLGVDGSADFKTARNSVMANLAFWCCATTSEIADMKVVQVRLNRTTIAIDIEGAHCRSIQLPRHLHGHMRHYLRLRRRAEKNSVSAQDYLFTDEGAITCLQHWTVRRCISSACITDDSSTPATPQNLRRAFMQITAPMPTCAGDLAYHFGKSSIVMRKTSTNIAPQVIESVTQLVRNVAI